MAVVAIASVVHVYGPSAIAPSPARASRAAPGEVAPTLYHCPMHPQIVRDQPGECPICSMTLVPIETARAGHGGAAGAAPASAPRWCRRSSSRPSASSSPGSRPRPSRAGAWAATCAASGVVAENERGLAQINTRFAGWIQDLFVSETGQRVTQGPGAGDHLQPRRAAAPSRSS